MYVHIDMHIRNLQNTTLRGTLIANHAMELHEATLAVWTDGVIGEMTQLNS